MHAAEFLGRGVGVRPGLLGTMSCADDPLVRSNKGRGTMALESGDLDRIHALETAQAVQAAAAAGVEATNMAATAGMQAAQAAAQVGTWAVMAVGSVSIVVGMLLGIAIAKSKS